MYATPFTASGAAHGSIVNQQKRKTFLAIKSHLPSLIGRCEVCRSWTEILNPLQVAKEDIEAKTLALFESLKSEDTRIIQLQLQGSIQTQVNQGPLFLAKELLSVKPAESGAALDWDDLRLAFINFLHICRCAITRNRTLIEPDRLDYHNNLEANFEKITAELCPLMNPLNC
jgi:hypothetical protein